MNNIKKIRKQKGLTITELASQIGMSQANLTKIENNQIELKTEIAKKIADTLNVSLSAIQNNEELKGVELINPEAYQLPNLSNWNIPPQVNIDSKTSKAYILADDTMSPTIKEHSICIVDTSNTTLNNGVFLIKYNNLLLIRRLQITH